MQTRFTPITVTIIILLLLVIESGPRLGGDEYPQIRQIFTRSGLLAKFGLPVVRKWAERPKKAVQITQFGSNHYIRLYKQ